MYGVPIEAVEPYSAPDAAGVEVTESGLSRIGRSLWHGMTLHGVEVASTYESPAPGALRLTTNTVIDDVWRRSFGLPAPSAAWPESFVSTRLVAQVDMAYWEDDDAFHTVIFGGTAAIESDPEFLAAQMAAVREVIARTYPELGFATG
jgi:hypothetical protein